MGAVATRPRARTRIQAGLSMPDGVRLTQWIALSVAGVIGLLGLASYVTRTDLQSFFPGNTPFAANVSIALSLAVVGIVLDGRRAAMVLGVIVAFIGALTLSEHIFALDLGVDKLVFEPFRSSTRGTGGALGRMAPNTAGCFLLIGGALIVRGRSGTLLTSFAFLVALIAVLGHTASEANGLAAVGNNAKMLLPTAVGLLFVSFSLLLQREHDFFTRDTVGGTVTRRLGPAILLLPLFGGALLLEGIHDNTFSAASGIWVMSVGAVIVALGVLFWISSAVDRQEAQAHSWLSQQAATAAALSEGLLVRRESDGHILSTNPAIEQMFGYSRDELVGTARRLVTAEHEAAMHAAVVEGGLYNAEVETVRADGTPFWASIKASSFADAEHGPMRVTLYHDITDRRVAEEERRGLLRDREKAIDELERSNKELEQFAHVASHDLSEPLRVVAGFTGLIQRRYKGKLDDDADQFIDATISGVERMQALIDALLAYSRVGSGELKRELVDIGRMVNQVHDALGVRIAEADGVVEIEGDLPTVAADPVLLQRVFQNLISNAMKFTGEEPPRIVVSAEATGVGEWTFRVADNGEGIDPQHAERVFGMFQRLHGRERPGTGIGLSITRRIVEKHGGQIWVVPAEGGGSVFTFTIGVSEQ